MIRLRFSLAVVLSIGFAAMSPASPVTWLYHGTIRSQQLFQDGNPDADIDQTVAALSALGAGIGSEFVGTVVFESETPGSQLIPGVPITYFLGAITDLTLHVGTWSPTGPAGSNRDIAMASHLTDPIGSQDLTAVDLSDPTGSFSFAQFSLSLTSHQPGFFDYTTLLLDPPPLGSIDPFGSDPTSQSGFGSGILLTVRDANGAVLEFAEITSLVRVPEPAAAALVLAALAALVSARSRA